MVGEALIPAYKALEGYKHWSSIENIIADVTPIIEEIRQAGKIPVVETKKLGDHLAGFTSDRGGNTAFEDFMGNFSGEEIEQKTGIVKQNLGGYASFYSALLTKNFSIGNDDKIAPIGNIVRIGDHHVFYQEAATDAEIAFICPCCIGLTSTTSSANEKAMEYGYRLFPLKYSADITPVIDNLMGMIEQKRAEIEAQKLSAATSP